MVQLGAHSIKDLKYLTYELKADLTPPLPKEPWGPYFFKTGNKAASGLTLLDSTNSEVKKIPVSGFVVSAELLKRNILLTNSISTAKKKLSLVDKEIKNYEQDLKKLHQEKLNAEKKSSFWSNIAFGEGGIIAIVFAIILIL